VGQVVLASGSRYGGVARSDRSYCTIGVNDPEIGWQVVEAYGPRAVGQAVALICLTAAHRCMLADQVTDRVASWPATPRMAISTVSMGLGALLWLTSRRRDRASTQDVGRIE
jgi:hypothetical protein